MNFYSYGALGTDKYPPFSLEEDPDYPADLYIPYPERLSQGLVLVKWWLLALPHYAVVFLFYFISCNAENCVGGSPGLITILVIISAVCVLFSGNYPKDIFKLVVGLNRWCLRVAAYASLMTDEYPPFRLWDD